MDELDYCPTQTGEKFLKITEDAIRQRDYAIRQWHNAMAEVKRYKRLILSLSIFLVLLLLDSFVRLFL